MTVRGALWKFQDNKDFYFVNHQQRFAMLQFLYLVGWNINIRLCIKTVWFLHVGLQSVWKQPRNWVQQIIWPFNKFQWWLQGGCEGYARD